MSKHTIDGHTLFMTKRDFISVKQTEYALTNENGCWLASVTLDHNCECAWSSNDAGDTETMPYFELLEMSDDELARVIKAQY